MIVPRRRAMIRGAANKHRFPGSGSPSKAVHRPGNYTPDKAESASLNILSASCNCPGLCMCEALSKAHALEVDIQGVQIAPSYIDVKQARPASASNPAGGWYRADCLSKPHLRELPL